MADKQKLIALLRALVSKLQLLKRIKLVEQKGLQPKVQRMAEQLIADMYDLGYVVTVHQGFRSFAEQDYLYAQGRTRPGAIITNAKAGQSFHNYGVAVDVVFIENEKPSWSNTHPWDLLGERGKAVGFEWGGDWKGFVDRPHFQYTAGYTLKDFQTGAVDNSVFK